MQQEQFGENTTREIDELREETESILRDLGLSSNAAKSFRVIAESSQLAASALCQKTGIADSKIYYALKELEEKNLVVKISGTPQLYSALTPNETCAVLGRIVQSDYKRKESKLQRLEKILRPLSRASEKSDILEIAYITRGFDNVVRRASKLLESSQKEVLGYLWDKELYVALSEHLRGAVSRDVKTRLALNPSFLKQSEKEIKASLSIVSPAEGKVLMCACNLFVIDGTKMISITRTRGDSYYAIITEDPGMVTLGISYYSNPSCCTSRK